MKMLINTAEQGNLPLIGIEKYLVRRSVKTPKWMIISSGWAHVAEVFSALKKIV